MESNPKTHDSLFKWLISAYIEDFFFHYFPDIKIGKYQSLDKEFISRYEALKESLKADLFITMEVEINGIEHEVIIHIEHESSKKDKTRKAFKYFCYGWLLKEKPVWSILFYTDDAKWSEEVSDKFFFSFDSVHGKQFKYFDVIKLNKEKSADLTAFQRQNSKSFKVVELVKRDRIRPIPC